MATDDARRARLKRLFDNVLYGKIPVNSATASAQFLEALPTLPTPVNTVERLVSSPHGLPALQTAVRSDLSPKGIDRAVQALRYLQDPDIRQISRGSLLMDCIDAVMQAESFWAALKSAFNEGRLNDSGQQLFGFFVLQLMTSSLKEPAEHLSLAQETLKRLSVSRSPALRNLVSQIKVAIDFAATPRTNAGEAHPGGRHDNDFADFREIAIQPTPAELACQDAPFLRTAQSVFESQPSSGTREAIYLDHQYRLLREDLIYEAREGMQIVQGKQQNRKSRGFTIRDVHAWSVNLDQDKGRPSKFTLVLRGDNSLPQFKVLDVQKRLDYLKKNPRFLKHQSTVCIFGHNNTFLGFATFLRDEAMMVKNKPEYLLSVEEDGTIKNILTCIDSRTSLTLRQVDLPLFAYEPVLAGLKRARTLPLSEELLDWTPGETLSKANVSSRLQTLVYKLMANPTMDLKDSLDSQKSIVLDAAQSAALIQGLTSKLSLIQGPPGTGKSFIGAAISKLIYQHSNSKILVVTYTNHALDQFLEDLLDVGILEADMVRLGGGKGTIRTEPLKMFNQNVAKLTPTQFKLIDRLKQETSVRARSLKVGFRNILHQTPSLEDILAYLEFEEPTFYEAFRVPDSEDGMTQVNKKNQAVTKTFLLEQWWQDGNAGFMRALPNVVSSSDIWRMSRADRQEIKSRWKLAIQQEEVELLVEHSSKYNRNVDAIADLFMEKDAAVLRTKQIIGCTTTGAAKYTKLIQEAKPDIVLVEEAGELLEAHVVTSLGRSAKQLILIGDHKQLRPKVNSYALTVEQGDGYDLNRSLFERLVLKGFPHQTLNSQHRMRPEISDLVRQLTYPNLKDAVSTLGRPAIRGLQDSLIFWSHSNPEEELKNASELRDGGSKASKQNAYESRMVLRVVRYLSQQGYRSDQMVVLTPYLGQLNKLRDELSAAMKIDPVLSDLDSHDLVAAGLMTPAAADQTKKSLRLATIDNYQGEESDIVIASLTRSNARCDIGFMSAPERLNVLLSRARDGLILIGNADTFAGSKKGGDLWKTLFGLMKPHMYDGLPVECARHPATRHILRTESDFTEHCPDGGCDKPCGEALSCGNHTCPSKCHQLSDHSQMKCLEVVSLKCPQGHNMSRRCSDPPNANCHTCERAKQLAAKQKQQAYERQMKAQQETAEHLRKMKELDEELLAEQEVAQEMRAKRMREQALRAKEQDVQDARLKNSQPLQPTLPPAPDQPQSTDERDLHGAPAIKPQLSPSESQHRGPDPHCGLVSAPSSPPLPAVASAPVVSSAESLSESSWQQKKILDGAFSDEVDSIMAMTGLERVKEQVLAIWDKVQLATRQGQTLSDERFNVAFLGNPGTEFLGKTTVARQFAKFLRAVNVVPGDAFEETTGSSLANEGVSGAKGLLQKVLAAEGGTIFVDEAYQLKSNMGGPAVLDYLLAEMENQVGKVVFIFAGYTREMDAFFEHNPGLRSRVPHSFHFQDFTDQQLERMLERMIHKKWGGSMKVEGGVHGLFGRVAIRRLGRQRDLPGFGNARSIENLLALITDRQTVRIAKMRGVGSRPDDLLLTREDLIGPDPAVAMKQSTAWQHLNTLIGLKAVKQSVEDLAHMIQANYRRELKEQGVLQISLNKTFLGSPGTGKTSVAKLYGQILVDLGLLSNGEVVVKDPSDFIGAALGTSEEKTKAILAATKGKVLVIDEAYMLYSGKSTTDSYKTAVIDTLVAEVQSTLGEDRCVLLLGYEHQMKDMFQHVNPGLSRRFAIEDAFRFEDFTTDELSAILHLKMSQQDLQATDSAKRVAVGALDRMKLRPNFGNGGDVENLLSKAKTHYLSRHRRNSQALENIVFEAVDFDPDYDRALHATTRLEALFSDTVGCEDIIAQLKQVQRTASLARKRGQDLGDLISTTYVFKGPPPGTGKTTTARKVGEVYYDMGMLARPTVHECSASDLIGTYVGHTGPLVKDIFEKAVGQVLFIDEAYRLNAGHFAKEATDEIVTLLTNERYKGKIVVVLAGYDNDMNALLASNRGLSSRFTSEIFFKNLPASDCIKILDRDLQQKRVILSGLDDQSSRVCRILLSEFEQFHTLSSWGNARDVKTLARLMVSKAFASQDEEHDDDDDGTGYIQLDVDSALEVADGMLKDRQAREVYESPQQSLQGALLEQLKPSAPETPVHTCSSTIKTAEAKTQEKMKELPETSEAAATPGRDAGVTDRQWHELEVAKKAQAERERKASEELQRAEEAARVASEAEQAQARKVQELEALAKESDENQANAEALKREQEAQRLYELELRRERQAREAELRAHQRRERERKQEEAKAQAKLREMGVCEAGFRWFKYGSGWRCGGGSHFVSSAELGL